MVADPLDSGRLSWYTRIDFSPGKGLQAPGTFSPALFILEAKLRELSCFLDESGSDNLRDRYYLLTLVLHEQSDPIYDGIRAYERSLAERGLPDVPFHAGPLLTGHDAYEGMDVATRRRLLSSFRVFFRHLPICHTTFAFRMSEFATPDDVSAAMRRHLVEFLFDRLDYLQSFDDVKIYYDAGQHSIDVALHRAMDYALAREAVRYKPATASDYRLSQAADYICTMELAALRYQERASTPTDDRFFGTWSQFKKGILKEIRAKQL